MVLYGSTLTRGESPPVMDLMLGMRYKCSTLVNLEDLRLDLEHALNTVKGLTVNRYVYLERI